MKVAKCACEKEKEVSKIRSQEKKRAMESFSAECFNVSEVCPLSVVRDCPYLRSRIVLSACGLQFCLQGYNSNSHTIYK